jgi:hypothetical protein
MKICVTGSILGLMVFLSACQPIEQKPPVQQTINNTDVLLTEGGEFPASLAGKWVADREGWEILLQPDGSIAACQHTVGRVVAYPGKTTTYPLQENGMGVVEAGTWSVQYTAGKRELAIDIILKKFTFVKGTDVVEGASRDLFVGRVSADGKTWTADWVTQPQYTVTTDTQNKVDLPIEETGQTMGTVIFTRQPAP